MNNKRAHTCTHTKAQGDIALSIAMTTISNIFAFASLPLLLFIWTWGLSTDIEFSIPFLDIFFSLFLVLFPTLAGIWLREKRESSAKIAGKVGQIGSVLLIASSIVVGFVTNFNTLANAEILPWKNIIAVILVAPLGMAFAITVTFSLRNCYGKHIELPAIATIAIETGVQNTVLAMAIVSLSFSAKLANTVAFLQLQIIVIMWGIIVSLEALCVTLVFRWNVSGQACFRWNTSGRVRRPICGQNGTMAKTEPIFDGLSSVFVSELEKDKKDNVDMKAGRMVEMEAGGGHVDR